MYRIIQYYNFKQIKEPSPLCAEHKQKCRSLNLKGRVYIAQEGINGTLAGQPEDIARYKTYVWSLPGFEDTEFKEDDCTYIPFVKLIVKTRPEIVTLKASEHIDPQKDTGGWYLSPKQWREILESKGDYLLIDVRNNYESRIGYFEGAIKPDIENFYDFEQWLDQAQLDKNRKILMYCTGGIRCEKFSILMCKKGFQNVNQLCGGIINYGQKEGDAHFRGKCFVFDDRLAIAIGKGQRTPVSYCEITGKPCDTYLNCANMECNKLFVCSREGAEKFRGCCSARCMASVKKRPFNPEGVFTPTRKWYRYFVASEFQKLNSDSPLFSYENKTRGTR